MVINKYITHLFFFELGLFFGILSGSIYPIVALRAEAQSLIEIEQESARKASGSYFTDHTNPKFTVNTYETLCRGYYTIEETDTEFIYTGYGILSDQYTYDIRKETERLATTTPDVIDIIIGNSATNTIESTGG